MEKIGRLTMTIKALLLILAFTPIALLADNLQLSASVSKNTVSLDENFKFTVELSGSSTSLPDVNFPDLSSFYVLSGPNQSTSIQYVNGAMSSSKSYSYILKPRKIGRFSIGKATAEADGKILESQPIILTVVKGAVPGVKKSPKKSSDASIAGQSLFLKTIVSRHQAFIGQQITVAYKLYFKVNVRTYEVESMPPNAGFWTEEFDMPQQPVIENEIINGINYNVATLRKVALFPTQVGKLSLEPMALNVEAIVRANRSRRSLFDSFFDSGSQSVRKHVASKAITIQVLPLPDKGKPARFRGAVGRFNLKLSIDKTAARVNDAISLKVRINGRGNLKLIQPPILNLPPDIERYDPKINTSLAKTKGIISGVKRIEYVLIPRMPGVYTIKPIKISFFNPASKRYETQTSKPFTLHITGKVNSNALNGGSGINHKEVALLGKDIRFIKESADLQVSEQSGSLHWWHLISCIVGLILFFAFWLYDGHRLRLSGNVALARNRGASRVANKLLADARKKLNSDDHIVFYKAVQSALTRFVQDKKNVDLTDFNEPTVRAAMEKHSVPPEQIEVYLKLLHQGDLKQFSGSNSNLAEKKEFLNRAGDCISTLGKYL